MTSLSSPLTFSASASIRLSSPLLLTSGQSVEVRPIPGVVPPHPLRQEAPARQNLTEDRGPENRGRARRAGQGAFGRALLENSPASSFASGEFATSKFLAQVLGQDPGSSTDVVVLHRNGPTLGSDAYRRAGGEPTYYSEHPRVLRIAV